MGYGAGRQIRVWKDNWLAGDKPKPAFGPGVHLCPDLKASDFLILGKVSGILKRLLN